MGDLYEEAPLLAALLDGEEAAPEEMLFFDTETTGLGVGAGNVPFLLGAAYYRGGSFIVEQMLIRNPSEEVAMLHYFNRLLDRFRYVVSYNGRTFDWPILKNRYILNRLVLDKEDIRQVDFLYPSRSLWRNTLPSCRLSKVEESRLGHIRVDDVPGSLAPMLYFRFLAEGDPSVLAGVLDHNEQDVLSLACLASHFGRALGGKLELDQMEAEELFRLGVWLEKYGKQELAETAFERLLAMEGQERSLYCLELASLYKKRGQDERAVALWKQMVNGRQAAFLPSVAPYIELAMYYEHKAKQYSSALYYAEEAMNAAWRRASLNRLRPKEKDLLEDIRKRTERLRRKLLRTQAGS